MIDALTIHCYDLTFNFPRSKAIAEGIENRNPVIGYFFPHERAVIVIIYPDKGLSFLQTYLS